MNEEIQVRFGGDLSGLSTALRGVKGMVKDAASDIAKGLSGIAMGFIGIEGVMKLREWAGETIKWAKDIRNLADEVGTSTMFIQQLQHVSEMLGLDANKAGDAMNFLSRKVGEAREGSKQAQEIFRKWGIATNGKTNEEIFYEIADALAQIKDPAERAAARFELLGKAGKDLAPALDHGSKALKEVASQTAVLTDAQVQQISNLGNAWKEFFENVGKGWAIIFASMGKLDAPQLGITEEMVKAKAIAMGMKPEQLVHSGKFVTGKEFSHSQLSDALQALIQEKTKEASQVAPEQHQYTATEKHQRAQQNLDAAKRRLKPGEEILKNLKEAENARRENFLHTLSDEQRLMYLTREKLALQRNIHDTSKSIGDRAKEQVQLEKVLKEIGDTQKTIDEKKTQAVEKQNEILKHRNEIAKLQRDREAASTSEYMPTVQQIAQSGQYVFRHNQWEWQQGPYAEMAQRLQFLQGDATQSLLWGNKGQFNQDKTQIDKLKEGLRSAGVMAPDDRLKSIDDNIDELTGGMQQVVDVLNKIKPSFE